MIDDRDIEQMRACIQLASRALGRTSPNPAVGAVVLTADGKVAGVGYHERAGQAHAEVLALDKAGENARGGTLYVSLEPCSHWGKTPPCTERVIASGVKRVVAAMIDPNPLVGGKGVAALEAAGIEVEVGVLEAECRWLNRGFVKKMTSGLPWLCLKLATTLDGKIADRHGSSRWISGGEARKHVHQLRNTLDCVLVGGTTALRDDPELNVRELESARNPARAVICPDLSISPSARICQQDSGGRTYIFCTGDALSRRGKEFPENVTLIATERDRQTVGYIDLKSVLTWLVENGLSTILCEGGGRLAAGLLADGLVDEIHWIVSPKILGDVEAVPAVAPLGAVPLNDARQLREVIVRQLGSDILISGLL
jgi:diaminohydroxyphosphoribosylaminopyrimidine deaminase/5-amino-6-(5-phosphoribosylamino)uracil reductase